MHTNMWMCNADTYTYMLYDVHLRDVLVHEVHDVLEHRLLMDRDEKLMVGLNEKCLGDG